MPMATDFYSTLFTDVCSNETMLARHIGWGSINPVVTEDMCASLLAPHTEHNLSQMLAVSQFAPD